MCTRLLPLVVLIWISNASFCAEQSFAQQLGDGAYYGRLDDRYISLHLFPDSGVVFTATDGTNGQSGRGKWRSYDGALELVFNNTLYLGFPVVETVASAPSETTRIHASIVDDINGHALPCATLHVEGSNPRVGTVTDIEGNASLAIAHPTASDTLVFRFFGYSSLRMPLKSLLGNDTELKARLPVASREWSETEAEHWHSNERLINRPDTLHFSVERAGAMQYRLTSPRVVLILSEN